MTAPGLLSPTLIQLLGWTLVHFLWQGAVVAAALAGALGLMRSRTAPARYLAACAALLLMAAAPAVTLALLPAPPDRFEVLSAPALYSGAGPTGSTGPSSQPSSPPQRSAARARFPAWPEGAPSRWGVSGRLEPLLPWLVGFWLGGVFVLSLRLLGGWATVQRLRRQTRPIRGRLEARVGELACRLGIARPVALLESTEVVVPSVIGWLQAAILVPAGALTGLPPQQLEAILAHELAHVRRHDYLVNLLQTAVETLLFYHPAVWWVSRQIRVERENCCDDLAVSVIGDPLCYARALTTLEELRAAPAALALAAADGDLLARVRRIVGRPGRPVGPRPPWLAGTVLVPLLLAAAALLHAAAAPERLPDAQALAHASQSSSPHRASSRAAVFGQAGSHTRGPGTGLPGARAKLVPPGRPEAPHPKETAVGADPPSLHASTHAVPEAVPPVPGRASQPADVVRATARAEESRGDLSAQAAGAPSLRRDGQPLIQGGQPGAVHSRIDGLLASRTAVGAAASGLPETRSGSVGPAQTDPSDAGREGQDREQGSTGSGHGAPAELSGMDLSGADLRGKDLARADLSGATLAGARLTGADLTDADLSGADLTDADLSHCRSAGANLSGATVRGTHMAGIDLTKIDLSGANLAGRGPQEARLAGAHLPGANLSGCDLSRQDLSHADLSDADLTGASLAGANLSGAQLTDARLARADLTGANLSGANLIDADLSRARLAGADLSGANLIGVKLAGVDLSQVNLSGATRAALESDELPSVSMSQRDLAGRLRPSISGRRQGYELLARLTPGWPEILRRPRVR